MELILLLCLVLQLSANLWLLSRCQYWKHYFEKAVDLGYWQESEYLRVQETVVAQEMEILKVSEKVMAQERELESLRYRT